MRISDWSSDVCSSDLSHAMLVRQSHPATTTPALYAHRSAHEMPLTLRYESSSGRHGPPTEIYGLPRAWRHRHRHRCQLLPGSVQPSAQLGRRRSPQRPKKTNTCTFLALRRSEEHTSELQSLMRISYAVFCLKKKKTKLQTYTTTN